MDLLVSSALLVAGLAMLCYGGNWLVEGGASMARRMGISNVVIGMTVVAYGTSTPELAASIAAAGEHPQIILGNIVGSNIANIGMVIGVSAVLVPLVMNRTAIRRELLVMIGTSVLLVALSVDGEISRYDGALLIGLLALFTWYTYRSIRRDRKAGTEQAGGGRPAGRRFYPKSLAMLGAGIALLYAGSELAVDNAVVLAEHFGISEKIIGITVIAIGTSLPELITSIIAIRKGHAGIGIGNIIGSNIYNALMIMGVASAMAGVTVVDGIYADYAVMIALSLVMLAVMRAGAVSRRVGAGLAAGYAVYIAVSLLYL